MRSFDDRLGFMTIVGLFLGSILFTEPGTYDPVVRSVQQSAHSVVLFASELRQDLREKQRNYDRLLRTVQDNRKAIREISRALQR
ncbi:hypothetical protein [Breoghania sp.]|uniref:hypothetical protein n=1 Tax=Breoghania sp. TaxID=2065378 RepID=UPI002AA921FD|nr:hypothetical protein [Breoghania sp.]